MTMRIDFRIGENSIYEQIVRREKDLQEKLKNFITKTIDEWKHSFEKENFLHLNEPLLRKEENYYIINIKPTVRIANISSE